VDVLFNPTTAALALLLVVLLVASVSRLWVAIVTSVAAALAFNYFFLPPLYTFTIADPLNWVALAAFFVVSVVASNLSSIARTRTAEAVARSDELARLFDLSRDVLLMNDSQEAIGQLPQFIARRFDLEFAAIGLPGENDWTLAGGGSLDIELTDVELTRVLRLMNEDSSAAGESANGAQRVTFDAQSVTFVPLRLGTRIIGLLAVAGRLPASGALDTLGGVVAIAVERAHFLDRVKAGELARQSEALKSALLASIAHDLRTPLTAIRVAAGNLKASWLTDDERREQNDLVLTEVDRLSRLFENILAMAQIDAGAISATQRWVALSEIVDAAREQAGELADRALDIQIQDALVHLDPRLTASAFAHLVENAAHYAPAGSSIAISASAGPDGVTMAVRDRGPGIAAVDLPHLFERFYRGTLAPRRTAGTGMGLSIARGLLAAEQGRVWAENCPDGGARFTIEVPAEWKPIEAA